MACSNLINGISIDCNDSQGGIETLYIANGKVQSIAEANGAVTAITVNGSPLVPADFFEFQMPRQTSSITETATPSQENGTITYEQSITAIFNKMDSTKRNTLLLLNQATDLVVVAKDNNGIFWSIGLERGAYVTTSTTTSGTSYGDRSGYEVIISGMEKSPVYEVNSSIVVA